MKYELKKITTTDSAPILSAVLSIVHEDAYLPLW